MVESLAFQGGVGADCRMKVCRSGSSRAMRADFAAKKFLGETILTTRRDTGVVVPSLRWETYVDTYLQSCIEGYIQKVKVCEVAIGESYAFRVWTDTCRSITVSPDAGFMTDPLERKYQSVADGLGRGDVVWINGGKSVPHPSGTHHYRKAILSRAAPERIVDIESVGVQKLVMFDVGGYRKNFVADEFIIRGW